MGMGTGGKTLVVAAIAGQCHAKSLLRVLGEQEPWNGGYQAHGQCISSVPRLPTQRVKQTRFAVKSPHEPSRPERPSSVRCATSDACYHLSLTYICIVATNGSVVIDLVLNIKRGGLHRCVAHILCEQKGRGSLK